MNAISKLKEHSVRKETDRRSAVNVPDDKLWGAQTQRSLEHFSIGKDLNAARVLMLVLRRIPTKTREENPSASLSPRCLHMED
jgi:fumarate hydratase class II